MSARWRPRRTRDRSPRQWLTRQQPRRRSTLRRRLTVLSAAIVAVAVVGLSLASWLLLRVQLRDEVTTTLHSDATRIVQRSDPLRLPSAPPWARLDVDTLFGVISSGGQARRPGFQEDALPVAASDVAVATRARRDALRQVTVDDTDYLMLTVAGRKGTAVQIAKDLTESEETLDRFAILLVAADAVVIVVTVSVGYALTRRGLRPVESVRRAAEHVASTQDLTAAVPITDTDPAEVASVAGSVNEMLTALAASRAAQRQLVEDAGHELATPLTSLRTNVDLLLRAERTPDRNLAPEDRRTLLEDIHAQMGELNHLIDEVLDLARDVGAGEDRADLDLADVLATAVTRASARTPHARFDLVTEPVAVHGKRAALERAVLNLLDNAAKWSPAGEPVAVRLARGAATAEVTVADRGPGIAEDELTRVFERFHRSADARSMPGSGLGLAIVAQVMEAHGGRAWLTRGADGGTTAHLELPT